jgi:hypothetical protein
MSISNSYPIFNTFVISPFAMLNELSDVIKSYHHLEKEWFGVNKNSNEYLAAVCLFEYPSYRLHEYDKYDRLIGFRTLVRTLRRILRNKKGCNMLDSSADSIVVSSSKNRLEIINYITRSGNAHIHSYLDRDHMSLGDFGNWSLAVRWLPFALRQSIKCISSPYRSNIALTIAEIPEIAFLIKYTKANGIRLVYDFLPYEVDSNFMYLMLQKNEIEVFKIPSSGALATHHKILLSDHLALSTPYHFEEVKKFDSTIRVRQVHLWPPEKAHLYYSQYKEKRQIEEYGTLGFYSHGEWLRRAQNHSKIGIRIGEAEEAILGMLGTFVRKNPNYKLRIFPHPRELKPEFKQDMLAHYRSCIGHDKFEIFTEQGGTSKHFAKAEIAISAFSTILYERLYCGYKTLIGNMFITEFPMNQSSLNSICFKTQDELEAMLNRFGNMNAETFFTETGLIKYRMESYPEP